MSAISQLRLKVAVDGSETRRFALDAPVNFARLQQLIGNLLQAPQFTVQYTDDEGEQVTIASDADLKEAVTLMEEMQQKALKLIVLTQKKDEVVVEAVKPKFVEAVKPVVVAEEKEIPAPAPAVEEKSVPQTPEEEKAQFDAALGYLIGQFSRLEPMTIQPEILGLVVIFQQVAQKIEAGENVQWDGLLEQVSAHAPVISSLPCFHDEHQKLFDSLEVITKFFANRVESGLLYPIPPHLAPLMFFKSEKVLKGLTQIQGVPLQLQVIFENLGAIVSKLETLHSDAESQDADAADEKVDGTVHTGVQCDNCGVVPIVGNRYKCTACHNFDLCEACESSGVHARDHELIKFKVAFVRRGPRFGGGPFGIPVPPFGGPHPFGHHGSHGGHPFGGHPQHGFGGPHCGGRGGRRWKNSQCPWNKKPEQAATPAAPTPALREGLGAQFLRDVNIEDKTILGRGQMHVKTWSVRNDGQSDWDNTVRLVYVSGNTEVLLDGQQEFEVPLLKSGETGDINVPFIVPQVAGAYKTVFKFVKNGQEFGHHVWVEFISE
jgi:hypothetical protein